MNDLHLKQTRKVFEPQKETLQNSKNSTMRINPSKPFFYSTMGASLDSNLVCTKKMKKKNFWGAQELFSHLHANEFYYMRKEKLWTKMRIKKIT